MSDSVTRIVENGRYRTIVGEHPDLVYLSVGSDYGASAMFLNPVHALEVAAALMDGAGRILERQFQHRMGSP